MKIRENEEGAVGLIIGSGFLTGWAIVGGFVFDWVFSLILGGWAFVALVVGVLIIADNRVTLRRRAEQNAQMRALWEQR